MINAEDMTVGLRVVVDGLGTLTLVEPVGRCPHCEPPQVEQVRTISGVEAYEAQRERGRGRDAEGRRMPIWELLDDEARQVWEGTPLEVREIVEVPPRTEERDGKERIAMVDGKALDVCERWSATDENGVLRVVDCRLCDVAPVIE